MGRPVSSSPAPVVCTPTNCAAELCCSGFPVLDDDLSFLERIEELTVEQLISELAVEALIASVLPVTAGIDTDWLDADFGQPGLEVTYDLHLLLASS